MALESRLRSALIGLSIIGLAPSLACDGNEVGDDRHAAETGALERPTAWGLPVCVETLAQDVAGVLDEAPRGFSGGYSLPSLSREDALERSLLAVFDGEGVVAEQAARAAGFDLCESAGEVRWRPDGTVPGAPLLVLRPEAHNPWAFSAPHPIFEPGSAEQALDLYLTSGAQALAVAGTHRCANEGPAGCSGVSRACGGVLQPHFESDMAHVVEGFFHRAHQVLAREEPTLRFASIHGMQGPGVGLSNGTLSPLGEASVLGRLGRALQVQTDLPVTTCNPVDGIELRQELCGTTNTQGRHLNQAPDACMEGALDASGRFLHIELSARARQNPELLSAAFSDALAGVP